MAESAPRGGVETAVAPPTPSASPAPPAVEAPRPEPRFGWVLPVDHGTRTDRAGQGQFLAPRYHGKHNGVDLLAPLGTPVLAPCTGKAIAGENSSHGKWAHVVCPLPAELGAGSGRHASFFFAHLSRVEWSDDATHDVSVGDAVGAVGKTGNAAGSSVAPHLHLEAIIQDSESSALLERHSGRNHDETRGSKELTSSLPDRCLDAASLTRRDGELWRGRRVDPFVLLTCLGATRPGYRRPSGAWAEASRPWSAYYSASFDVDSGVSKAPEIASRQ